MSDGMEELARRLVVGRKSDGRGVYDEAAKAELVAACGRPGASVSRLARECGVNANQLSRWVREHSQRWARASLCRRRHARRSWRCRSRLRRRCRRPSARRPLRMVLQARLPNGVVVDLREVDLQHVGEVIEALGRMRCSASTKA